MAYVTVTADVDVREALDEIPTDDLVEELERRGKDYITHDDEMRQLLEKVFMNRRNNKNYQSELDALIYGVLGRVV